MAPALHTSDIRESEPIKSQSLEEYEMRFSSE